MTREEKIAAIKSAMMSQAEPVQLSRAEKIQKIKAKLEELKPIEPSVGEQAQAGLESFADTALFGQLPKVQAAVGSMLPDPNADVNAALQEAGITIQEPGRDYESLLAKNVARQKQQSEQFPITTGAGSLGGALTGGGVVGAGLRGGAKLVAPQAVRGFEALQAAAKLPGASTASRTGALAARSGALGAEGAAFDALSGEAPGTGASIGAAIPVVGSLARASGRMGKTALTSAFGVHPKNIERALNNPKGIREAKSAQEIAAMANDAASAIKEKARLAGTDLIDEIQDGLTRAKSNVIEASNNAYTILENANLKVPTKELMLAAEKARKQFYIGGKAPIGESARQAIKKIDNFKSGLNTLPKELSGSEVKDILKQLDADIDYIQIPGTFTDNMGQRALKSIRQAIDQNLKSKVPEYATQMQEVANRSKLLQEASKLFGGENKAATALTRLGKTNLTNEPKNQILNDFIKSQGINPERFRKAQEASDIIKTWNGLDAVSKVQSFSNAKNYKIREMFKVLSKQTPEDLVQLSENLATKTAFETEFLRGSRNVNLWAIMGAASGFGLGGTPLGAATGAAIGAIIDKKGPQAALQILEFVSQVKGVPTVQKIMNSNLSPSTKRFLADELIAIGAMSGKEDEPMVVQPIDKVQTVQDISKSPNVSPLEKAKMISQVGKDEPVSGLRKVVFGNEKPKGPEVVQKEITPANSIAEIARRKQATTFNAGPGSFIDQKKEEAF